MNEVINVFLASDDNYAKWLGITVMSLIKTTKHPLEIYIISHRISPENKQKLKSLQTADAKINLLEVDEKIFNSCYYTERLPIASLIRTVVASILPDIDKIIWLDSDTLVLDDLWNLFNINLDKNIFAACKDVYCDAWAKRLEFDNGFYINSGVMTMNLILMRKYGVENKLLNILSQKKYPFQDQDALNIACYNQIAELPKKYNSMIKKDRDQSDVIIHYIWDKPWKTLSSAWEHKLFWSYFKNSPWKNEYYKIRIKWMISKIFSFIYRKETSNHKVKFILLNVPIIKISQNDNCKIYSFLGIPLLKKVI